MELLQLRYFLESAGSESFSRTARRYDVPVTSVSASVKRLERELGHDLFYRRANKIFLNERGRRLYEALSVGMATVDDALEAASDGKAEGREIRVLVRAMRRRVTDAIIAFRKTAPGFYFRVAFDTAPRDAKAFDLIVDAEGDRYPDLERFPWFETPLRLVAAASDPLCGAKRTLSELKDREFISMGQDSNTHAILTGACERAGFRPKIAVFCNDIECFEKLVAGGVGIGVMRAEHGESAAGIRTLNVSDFREKYRVFVYYKKDAATESSRRFLRFLQNG